MEPSRYRELAWIAVDRVKKAVDKVQGLTSSVDDFALNQLQCKRLAFKLMEFKCSTESTLLNPAVQARLLENWSMNVEVSKELFRVVEDAKFLVESCCRRDWLISAILLADSVEAFILIEIRLEWCRRVLNRAVSLPHKGEEKSLKQICKHLAADQRDVEERSEGDVQTQIRDLALTDQNSLTAKLIGALRQNAEYAPRRILAGKLLERLNWRPTSERPQYLWEVEPKDLNDLEPPISKANGIEVHRTTWFEDTFVRKAFLVDGDNSGFMQEATVVAGLWHPHITPTVCVCIDKASQKCSIVMEHMKMDLRGFLESFIDHDKFTLKLAVGVDILLQIAEGMRVLHERLIVHYDLKSYNILIKPSAVEDLAKEGYVSAKVADFGLSKTKLRTVAVSAQGKKTGTPRWMAPELYEASEHGTLRRPFKADVYSFGILCYEVLTGRLPFREMSNATVETLVKAGKRPTLPPSVPPPLASLIERCWDGNFNKRPYFPTICKELMYLKGLLMTLGDDIPLTRIKILQDQEASASHLQFKPFSCFRSFRNFKSFKCFKSFKIVGGMKIFSNAATSNLDVGVDGEVSDEFVGTRQQENQLEHLQEHQAFSPSRVHLETQSVQHETGQSLSISPSARDALATEMEMYSRISIEDMSHLILASPTNASLFNRRAALKKGLGDFGGAIKDLDEAIRLDPSNGDLWVSRGDAFMHLRDYQQAIDCCQRVHELLPDNGQAWSDEAAARIHLGDTEGALQCLNRAIEIIILHGAPPQTAGTIYYFRGQLKFRKGELMEALEDLELANQFKPNDYDILLEIGQAKCGLDQHQGAMEVLNCAIDLDPNRADGYVARALVKMRSSNLEGAMQDINTGAVLDPNSLIVRAVRPEITRRLLQN